MLFLIAIFLNSSLAFSDNANSEQTFKEEVCLALESDPVYLLYVDDLDTLISDVKSTKLLGNRAIKDCWTELESVYRLNSDDEADLESELINMLSGVPLRGGACLVGYNASHGVKNALILQADGELNNIRSTVERIKTISVRMLLNVNVIREGLPRNGEEQITSRESSGAEICKLPIGRNHFLEFTVYKNKIVISDSSELLDNVLRGLSARAKSPIVKDRSFLRVMAAVDHTEENTWLFLSPRNLKGRQTFESLIGLDKLLPFFPEHIETENANNIVGIGASLQINRPDEGRKNGRQFSTSPVCSLETVLLTQFPPSGAFRALAMPKEVQLPSFDFNLDDYEIKNISVYCCDFAALFQSTLGSNSGSTVDSLRSLEEKYHLDYSLPEWYEACSDSYCEFLVRDRTSGEILSGTALHCESAESAGILAESLSKSGFLNQQFPPEKNLISGRPVFSRTPSKSEEMRVRLGLSNVHESCYFGIGRWMYKCAKPNAEQLINRMNESNRSLSFSSEVSDIVNKFSEDANIVYFALTSVDYLYGELGKLRSQLEFEKQFQDQKGYSMEGTPQSTAERLLLNVRFRVLQAVAETMGDMATTARYEDSQLNLRLQCFEPLEASLIEDFYKPTILEFLDTHDVVE